MSSLALTRNYRSVPPILAVANKLSARADTGERDSPETPHGAFFIPYKNAERDQLISAFQAAVLAAGLSFDRSAVLCRSRALADQLAGVDVAVGQGVVKGFALAAVLRDKQHNYLDAFKTVAACVLGLVANAPQGLLARSCSPPAIPKLSYCAVRFGTSHAMPTAACQLRHLLQMCSGIRGLSRG